MWQPCRFARRPAGSRPAGARLGWPTCSSAARQRRRRRWAWTVRERGCWSLEPLPFLWDCAPQPRLGVKYVTVSCCAALHHPPLVQLLPCNACSAVHRPPCAGSALLQRTIQVVPSDSPAARVAVSRALRSSYPPAGLVPVPVPMFAGGSSAMLAWGMCVDISAEQPILMGPPCLLPWLAPNTC